MAIERTNTGRKIYICDVCADEGIQRVWLRRPGLKGDPENCSGPAKHVRWNYREKEKAKEKRAGRKRGVIASRVKKATRPARPPVF